MENRLDTAELRGNIGGDGAYQVRHVVIYDEHHGGMFGIVHLNQGGAGCACLRQLTMRAGQRLQLRRGVAFAVGVRAVVEVLLYPCIGARVASHSVVTH